LDELSEMADVYIGGWFPFRVIGSKWSGKIALIRRTEHAFCIGPETVGDWDSGLRTAYETYIV
jgi:hypothetical protein